MQNCGRQFVENSQHIGEAERDLIKPLLLERLPSSGLCRVMKVPLRWPLTFNGDVYDCLPKDLNVELPRSVSSQMDLLRFEAEADEIWGFVKRKRTSNGSGSRLMSRLDRSSPFTSVTVRARARKLWDKIPRQYREQSKFHTDDWEAYKSVIPEAQHRVCTQGGRDDERY